MDNLSSGQTDKKKLGLLTKPSTTPEVGQEGARERAGDGGGGANTMIPRGWM